MIGINRWIDELGVRVVYADLPHMHGGYMHDLRAIVVDGSMAPIQLKSTLAHELGHAFHGHEYTTPRTEREASEWGARVMIRGCKFWLATRMYDTPQEVAAELGVLPRDVVNYADWFDRSCKALRERNVPQTRADIVSRSGAVGLPQPNGTQLGRPGNSGN